MPNQNQIIIDGHGLKEMRCKNDSCRALIGYDNIMIGVFAFFCTKCGTTSVFKMQYRQMGKDLIDKLQKKFEGGGEIKNG